MRGSDGTQIHAAMPTNSTFSASPLSHNPVPVNQLSRSIHAKFVPPKRRLP
jgi:hypothetical protein